MFSASKTNPATEAIVLNAKQDSAAKKTIAQGRKASLKRRANLSALHEKLFRSDCDHKRHRETGTEDNQRVAKMMFVAWLP